MKIFDISDTILISYLEASINYTVLHYIDGSKKVSGYTLKRFEEALAKNKAFVRTHRSYIINKEHLVSKNDHQVILVNEVALPLARRRKI